MKVAPRKTYLLVCALLAVTVIRGFGGGYFWPMLTGGVSHFWFIHLHAFVFLVWMLLLLVQAGLVIAGRVDWHRSLGVGGLYWGVLVVVVGLYISVAAPLARQSTGQLTPDLARLVIAYNLTDMIAFIGFFAAAMIQRAQPHLHRRLIVCAATALTGAAVGRVLPSDSIVYLFVWLIPLLVAIGAELRYERRVHPIYVLGLAVFLFMFLKVELYALLL